MTENPSESELQPDDDVSIEGQSGAEDHDQDADPSLNAPEGGPQGQG